jgi:2-succinyl-6-hydroxy-2,4-cyclohexadiene-1-carboxylate synthase
MTRVAVNDVHLNVEVRHAGPALLLLHGFTGSSVTWFSHSEAWRAFTTIAVDLLGHGRSDCLADPNRYRMERCVEDLLVLLDHLGVQRTAVLGYSMGGRIALYLALHAPQRLWALVLESASPGIEDVAEREARRQSDLTLAETLERDGIVTFVDRWHTLPLFATQAQLPASIRAELRRQRLGHHPQGLANSLRGLGTVSGVWVRACRNRYCNAWVRCRFRRCCSLVPWTPNIVSWPTGWRRYCLIRGWQSCQRVGTPSTLSSPQSSLIPSDGFSNGVGKINSRKKRRRT